MFMLLRIYDDCTSGTEYMDNMPSALRACSIYLEAPDCIGVKIWNTETGEEILNYWREEEK